jgi:hypothetical protein
MRETGLKRCSVKWLDSHFDSGASQGASPFATLSVHLCRLRNLCPIQIPLITPGWELCPPEYDREILEHRRCFADRFLLNGETILRGAENGRSDAEIFLGCTESGLDDEEYIPGGGEYNFRNPELGRRR